MRLPSFKRIFKQDFEQDDQPLVDKLSNILNIGIESLYDLANNKVTLNDNIACVVKDVTLSVKSSGTPTTAITISLGNIIQTVIGATVISATNTKDSTVFPNAQPFVTFSQNGQVVTITNVAGLPVDNTFILKVVLWGT